MKALITDGSYIHTVGIIRYLGINCVQNYIVGNNKYLDIAKYSKFCHKYIIGPKPENEVEFIKLILEILAKEKIDIVIPVSYLSTAVCSKYKSEIKKYSKIEIADFDKISIALNKKLTYKLAEQEGVSFPKTYYPKSINEVEKLSKQIEYPVVIKWLFEVGRNIVVIVNDEKKLVNEYNIICQKYEPEENCLPMIQEYIPTANNKVYCFSALYQKGKCKRIFIQKQIRNVPANGGTCAFAESFYNREIIENSQKLLDSLNWNGVAHIEYKLDIRDNKFKLLEINPKFWASTEMSLKAGVNFPFLLLQMSQGINLNYSEEYDRNLKFHFPFSREIEHIKDKPSSIFHFIKDCLNPFVKSNVWLNDFMPNIVELALCLVNNFIPNKLKKVLSCYFFQK